MTGLNGMPLETARVYDWILPEIDRLGDQSIQFTFTNATYYPVTYDITRVAKDGKVIDAIAQDFVGANNRQFRDMVDVFPRSDVEREGYLWMTSPEGLQPSEIYNNSVSKDWIRGIDRRKYKGIYKIYSPQFANVPGWRTVLNLINANEAEAGADVTISLHAADGRLVGQLQQHFAMGEQLKDDLAVIFEGSPGTQNITGWLEIESTLDYILGTLTFHGEGDRYVATYELSGTPLSRFLFPVVSQNDAYQTGVALLNGNPESAQVNLEVWGTDGTIVAQKTITIPAMTRIAVYLDTLFPDMNPLLVGNLRISSDKALYGFSLMNDSGFNFLMAMPAIPLF